MKVNSGIEAYPLSWPEGWERAKDRERSRFKTTFGVARDCLFAELRRMGARYVTLSSNVPLRNDGMPYANHRQPNDPGVAVYFQHKGKSMVLACDRWDSVTENVQAIKKTLEAIRGIERWGASDMLERAFSGFAALPPPVDSARSWWEVLGVPKDADLDAIRFARNRLAQKHHPDVGDEPDCLIMNTVNRAYEDAVRARGQS